MNSRALYATSIGVVVVALSASIYLIVSRGAPASASVPRDAKNEERAVPAGPSDEMIRRMRALESRVAAQEAADAENAVVDVPIPRASAAPPASLPSDAQTIVARQLFFQTELEAGVRDRAAQTFEKSVSDFVASQLPGALEAVDCRASICKLTFNHTAGTTREDIGGLWANGPFVAGSWDYLTEDGTRTIAYIGTPGHGLPILDLYGNPVDLPAP